MQWNALNFSANQIDSKAANTKRQFFIFQQTFLGFLVVANSDNSINKYIICLVTDWGMDDN